MVLHACRLPICAGRPAYCMRASCGTQADAVHVCRPPRCAVISVYCMRASCGTQANAVHVCRPPRCAIMSAYCMRASCGTQADAVHVCRPPRCAVMSAYCMQTCAAGWLALCAGRLLHRAGGSAAPSAGRHTLLHHWRASSTGIPDRHTSCCIIGGEQVDMQTGKHPTHWEWVGAHGPTNPRPHLSAGNRLTCRHPTRFKFGLASARPMLPMRPMSTCEAHTTPHRRDRPCVRQLLGQNTAGHAHATHLPALEIGLLPRHTCCKDKNSGACPQNTPARTRTRAQARRPPGSWVSPRPRTSTHRVGLHGQEGVTGHGQRRGQFEAAPQRGGDSTLGAGHARRGSAAKGWHLH